MTPEYAAAWLGDESNLRKLNGLFNDPTFQAALSIVRSKGRPGKIVAIDGTAALTHSALENSRCYGFHQSLDVLLSLVTKPTQNQNIPEPEPFMDQAVESLRERGLEPKNL